MADLYDYTRFLRLERRALERALALDELRGVDGAHGAGDLDPRKSAAEVVDHLADQQAAESLSQLSPDERRIEAEATMAAWGYGVPPAVEGAAKDVRAEQEGAAAAALKLLRDSGNEALALRYVSAFERSQNSSKAVGHLRRTGEGNEAAKKAMNDANEDFGRVETDVYLWFKSLQR